VPVAIENSWKILKYGTYPLRVGERLRWTVLSPIEPVGKMPEDVVMEAELAIRKIVN
jgi:1-acyl-sn-glycerol-3-phosphate acyltransferase